jgi:hypothetical protein
MNGVLETPMETISLLFNQTPKSLRRIGARGGKACARNRRARQQVAAHPPAVSVPVTVVPIETTAQAIVRMEAEYPWLRSAKPRAGTRI